MSDHLHDFHDSTKGIPRLSRNLRDAVCVSMCSCLIYSQSSSVSVSALSRLYALNDRYCARFISYLRLTRLAARKSRKRGTKVIYTAHGFHFFKGAPKFNWMFFYPIEKYCARYTDKLITINREDFELAKRKFKAWKNTYKNENRA
mgnify:CR=1 FL=1